MTLTYVITAIVLLVYLVLVWILGGEWEEIAGWKEAGVVS